MNSPQQIRKQRLRLAIAAVLGACCGLGFAVIWVSSLLWRVLVGR